MDILIYYIIFLIIFVLVYLILYNKSAINLSIAKKGVIRLKKAILVSITQKNTDNFVEYNLKELAALANTLDISCIYQMIQNVDKMNPKFLMGSGKVEELAALCASLEADLIIFDNDLSPAQERNIEEATKVAVYDRNRIILDIFEQRAKTREAKLEVALAKNRYMLPRINLVSRGMSHQMGKGEGESKTDLEKRIIAEEINRISKELQDINRKKEVESKKRKDSSIPIVALVGYTNAGKSSTMNKIINYTYNNQKDDKLVYEKNELFATLQTSSRKINYKNNDFILVDTIGFINKLPHHLVNSFLSTLKEAQDADLIILVVDGSDEDKLTKLAISKAVLESLDCGDKPYFVLQTKSDLVENIEGIYGDDFLNYSNKNDNDVTLLLDKIVDKLSENKKNITVLIPYSDAKLISYISANETILYSEVQNEGMLYNIIILPEDEYKYRKYLIAPNGQRVS